MIQMTSFCERIKRNGKNASTQEVEAAPQDNVAMTCFCRSKGFHTIMKILFWEASKGAKRVSTKSLDVFLIHKRADTFKCQLTSTLLPLHHLVEGVAVEAEANLCRSWPPKGTALFCLPKAEAMETETIRKFFLNHVIHFAPDAKEISGYQTIFTSMAQLCENFGRCTSHIEMQKFCTVRHQTVLDTFWKLDSRMGMKTWLGWLASLGLQILPKCCWENFTSKMVLKKKALWYQTRKLYKIIILFEDQKVKIMLDHLIFYSWFILRDHQSSNRYHLSSKNMHCFSSKMMGTIIEQSSTNHHPKSWNINKNSSPVSAVVEKSSPVAGVIVR